MNWNDHYDKENFTLNIPYYFQDDLIDLPFGVKNIIFNKNFRNNFYSLFNKSVGHQECNDNDCPRNLPSSITHLTFGSDFNKNVDRLPPNLTYLTFGKYFNQSVDSLPQNLTHLTFGYDFNQNVDKLPQNLTHLTFGTCFNKSVDKLPPNLTHLTFGHAFNQSIDNLPISLKYICFHSKFKKINYIPEQIDNIEIIFNAVDNKPIDNLPSHIKQIKIKSIEELHFIKKIPFGCKIIDGDNNEIFS